MWTSPVRVREVWVRRPGGPLLVPFDVPGLELDHAIARGWSMSLRVSRPPACWLLLPNPPDWLPTYPLTRWEHPDRWWFPHDPRPLIITQPGPSEFWRQLP